MKRVMLALFVLALLALDWAALHDILKGNEPNYYGEYTTLAASVLILAALAWRWRRSIPAHN